MTQGQGHSRDRPGPTAPYCAVVLRFGAGPGWASQPDQASGLASAVAIVPAFILFVLFKKNYQHCKRLIYTSYGTGIFTFKAVLEHAVFSLTFP